MTSGGRLAQRVALVTGGGGEIGGAICRRFAAEGAEVAIADLDPAKSEAVARAIAGGGGRALALQVDVADEASAKDAVERTIASFGRLTTLVNVAATVTPDGTVETLSLDDWTKAISVNLTGAFVMCKYAIPALRRAGGGSIINIASQLAYLGVPLRSPYCTTKAASSISPASWRWTTPSIKSAPTRSRPASSSPSAPVGAPAARSGRAPWPGHGTCSIGRASRRKSPRARSILPPTTRPSSPPPIF